MAPDQLTGVEIWGVTRQVIYGQLAVEFRGVFLDSESLVGRQSIDDQMQEFPASSQQIHEQWAGQGPHIGGDPEGAFRTDGRRGTDALTLAETNTIDVWPLCPSSYRGTHRLKTRLIPEIDLPLSRLAVREIVGYVSRC